jgi:hypothetical protein
LRAPAAVGRGAATQRARSRVTRCASAYPGICRTRASSCRA